MAREVKALWASLENMSTRKPAPLADIPASFLQNPVTDFAAYKKMATVRRRAAPPHRRQEKWHFFSHFFFFFFLSVFCVSAQTLRGDTPLANLWLTTIERAEEYSKETDQVDPGACALVVGLFATDAQAQRLRTRWSML